MPWVLLLGGIMYGILMCYVVLNALWDHWSTHRRLQGSSHEESENPYLVHYLSVTMRRNSDGVMVQDKSTIRHLIKFKIAGQWVTAESE